jgi:hypothetical protein
MSRQTPLTLVTPVKPESRQILAGLLAQVRQDLQDQKFESFEKLGTIHYARWITIDAEPGSASGVLPPERLVFSSNFDGTEQTHLFGLATTAADFIDKIYEHCVGYPSPGDRTPEKRIAYLRQWKVKESAFYIGAPGRDLSQIKNEASLRNHIRSFLNTRTWANSKSTDVYQEIQKEVFSRPEFQWAKNPIKLPGINWPGMILLGLVLLILSPILIVWILLVHFLYERTDKPLGLKPSQVNEEHLQQLEQYEDLETQNQFTQVLVMKPGAIRLLTLKGLMLFAKSLIAFLFTQGKLMGIPTIHFARWVMIDNNKTMLFFSNFDGSWQQYLGDFIDKSGWGLTGIWSNTVNFPKTRFLFTGGAYDEEHFLAWSRYYEIPTQVWYCAYPDLSIKNIVNNSIIRQQLALNLDDQRASEFLKRF